jgi:NAD(P)-dependent dehydrogenase (short-subunit alcohol dehydrogenase family)
MTDKLPTRDISLQRGRTIVVTGIGGRASKAGLPSPMPRGGDPGPGRGAAAIERIRRDAPGADIAFEVLDLGSLASVAAFRWRLATERGRVEFLINNAGMSRRRFPSTTRR